MPSERAQALYYDSAATLRLVDVQLDELRDGDAAPAPVASAEVASVATPPAAAPATSVLTATLADLPGVLERANLEINTVLARLRESRSALQATAVDQLTHTQDKLREVTNATELAATDIMDACDRATAKLDELDGLDETAPTARDQAAQLRGELRDELFTMMAALQFQDLTTQMLSHANAVLTEVETRLQDVARIFEGAAAPGAPALPTVELTFDPNATVRDADKRQAVADAVFGATARSSAAA